MKLSLFALITVLLGLFAQPGRCDDNKTEQVYELTPDITPPRILRHVDPDLPANLKGVRVEGVVTLALIVDSHGDPKDPRVIKGLEKDVDESAIAAVKKWRFAAAKKDGRPVAVRISVEIEFHSM